MGRKKGYNHSGETKMKIGFNSGKSREGKKHSEEHRKNISKSLKGKKPKNLENLRSEEINLKRKQKMEEIWENPSWDNKKRSKKISNSKIGKKNPLFGRGGKNHWNWKGGKGKILTKKRYGDDWDNVRMIVYERDNYTCQKCGISMNESIKKFKQPLHVHHIIPFLKSFDNSMSNLIALCPRCHRKVEAELNSLNTGEA